MNILRALRVWYTQIWKLYVHFILHVYIWLYALVPRPTGSIRLISWDIYPVPGYSHRFYTVKGGLSPPWPWSVSSYQLAWPLVNMVNVTSCKHCPPLSQERSQRDGSTRQAAEKLRGKNLEARHWRSLLAGDRMFSGEIHSIHVYIIYMYVKYVCIVCMCIYIYKCKFMHILIFFIRHHLFTYLLRD